MKCLLDKKIAINLIVLLLLVSALVIGITRSDKAHAVLESQDSLFSNVLGDFFKEKNESKDELFYVLESNLDLHNCTDEKLGFKLLCNPEWDFREEDNALMLIIDSNPKVTMTLVKMDSSIEAFDQLNSDNLNALGQYEKGFDLQQIVIAGMLGVKLNAYSSQDPDMRFSDYYFVNDKTLYGLLFSVDPSMYWENYQILFDKIAGSLEII